MKEGYITLAVGGKRYLELALNLALSIKLNDKRQISLLHDKKLKIPETYKEFFDKIIEINPGDLLTGCTNKINLYKYSPYEKTVFLDSDCLLYKNDLDFFWDKLRDYNITVQGYKKYKGSWSGIKDIEQYLKKNKLPYLIPHNGGFLYFDKSEKSKKVFDKITDYYENQRDKISFLHEGKKGEYCDECIISAAMSHYNLEPLPEKIEDKNLVYSTLISNDFELDLFNRKCSFTKEGNKVSPSICHFVNLAPQAEYYKDVTELRKQFEVPRLKQWLLFYIYQNKIMLKAFSNLRKIYNILTRKKNNEDTKYYKTC